MFSLKITPLFVIYTHEKKKKEIYAAKELHNVGHITCQFHQKLSVLIPILLSTNSSFPNLSALVLMKNPAWIVISSASRSNQILQ